MGKQWRLHGATLRTSVQCQWFRIRLRSEGKGWLNGNIRRQLEEKTKELVKAELAAANGFDSSMVRVIQVEVNELLEKESLMWQQRVRILFLKLGDRNTCYFHQKASHRYKRNRILGLKNNNNVWCTSD